MRHDISTRWVLYGSTCVFFDRLSRAYLEVFPTSTGVIEELRHAPYLFWNIQNTEKHLADPQFRSPLLCPFNQDIPDIFLRTLFMFRHTICQSSQDKIYALVNASRLNRLKFSFPIDYSLDFKDLYIEVARSCLRENLTDLLICATVTETAESRQRCELPSWVPDWRYPQSDLAPGLQQVVLAFEKACVSPGVLRDDSPGLSYLTGSGMVDSMISRNLLMLVGYVFDHQTLTDVLSRSTPCLEGWSLRDISSRSSEPSTTTASPEIARIDDQRWPTLGSHERALQLPTPCYPTAFIIEEVSSGTFRLKYCFLAHQHLFSTMREQSEFNNEYLSTI